jgi:hypothetical protein
MLHDRDSKPEVLLHVCLEFVLCNQEVVLACAVLEKDAWHILRISRVLPIQVYGITENFLQGRNQVW